MKAIQGMHHVTSITSDAQANYNFYTQVLGMRLLKKTVNQDDVSAYHTFFGDEHASAGNDLTFFDFQGIPKARRGTNAISSIGLRVPSDAALDYWLDRFNDKGVQHEGIETLFNTKGIRFEDFDGLRLRLLSDEHNQGGFAPGIPNTHSDVPTDFAIVGLGTVELTVRHSDIHHDFLVEDLKFELEATEDQYTRYVTGPKGNSSSIHVIQDQRSPNEVQGYGAVHHIALRVEGNEDILQWAQFMQEQMIPNSGFVERHYFQSLYARVGSILYEFATDTPGFTVDEPLETLGEKLSLPPFLEDRREEIEKNIRPLETKRVNYAE